MASVDDDSRLWAAAGVLADLNADVIELLAASDVGTEGSDVGKLKDLQEKLAKFVGYLQRNSALPQTPFVDSAISLMRDHLTGELDRHALKDIARAVGWMQAVIQANLLLIGRSDRPPSLAWSEHERTWRESALLATLTEKFYSSFAFKTAVGALVFIILFAVSGTMYLGNQSYNVRGEMRDTAADAKRDIDTMSKQVQDTIDAQQKSLALLDAKLRQNDEELTKKFDDAKADVSARRQDFERFASDLKTDSLKEATSLVSQELKNPESQLRQQIAIDKEKLLKALTEVEAKIASEVQPRIDNIESSLHENERKVRVDTADIAALTPSLANLRNLTQQSDALAATVAGIQANGTRAANDVLVADRAAQEANNLNSAANQQAAAAAEARKGAQQSLAAVQAELIGYQRDLVDIQRGIEQIKRQTAATEASLSHKDTPSDAVPSGSGEDGLDVQTWRRIQQGLIVAGFSVGRVDGIKGGNTTAAIRSYQAQRKEPVSGVLTAAQRDTLLALSKNEIMRPPPRGGLR